MVSRWSFAAAAATAVDGNGFGVKFVLSFMVSPALFEAVARKARFRARFLGYADLALGLLLVAGMVLGTIMVPGPVTAGIAVLMISATIWISVKRRALRQMSLTLDTNDRHSFIRVAARSAGQLPRLTSACGFPPFALLTVLFKLSCVRAAIPHPFFLPSVVSTRGASAVRIAVSRFSAPPWRKSLAEIPAWSPGSDYRRIKD